MTGQPLYNTTAERISRLLTRAYSTSFSSASSLFPSAMRQHIYNVYGLVRIADEIVDTYTGKDAARLLDDLEAETYAAIKRGYSPNPIVHAFQLTANTYGISKDLIEPFFVSMRLDTSSQHFDTQLYETYIYGSAEVVGLMCLRIFTAGNAPEYNQLAPGARALGAAFQKVNFLRDLGADHSNLGRWYFPFSSFDTFTAADKRMILDDIAADFNKAEPAIQALPRSVKPAVFAAFRYYRQLYKLLADADAETIKTQRLRVPNAAKLRLVTGTVLKTRLSRQK